MSTDNGLPDQQDNSEILQTESNEGGPELEIDKRSSSKKTGSKRGSKRSIDAKALPPAQQQMQDPVVVSNASDVAQVPSKIAPQSIGVSAAPVQVSMDGGESLEKPAAKLERSDTLGDGLVFFEAGSCIKSLDEMQRCCSCCCGFREFFISNKGLKITSQRPCCPCSETVSNIDWTSIESVDYETGCCYGYVEMNTRDHEVADTVLRVHKSEVENIQQMLLNLSTGSKAYDKEEVVRETKQACSCCEPLACLTSYTVTSRALKIKRHRCLPCMGFEGVNLRWMTKHGTDNIVDIDTASDCCYGYIYLYTNDPKPDNKHVTMRVRHSEVDQLVADLRTLNTGASGRQERAVATFEEAGCLCGLCDMCTPSFCRAFSTKYLVTSQGLSIQKWSPCFVSTNHISWTRVLDVDMETSCCLGVLDLHYFDQAEFQNSKLRVSKKRIDNLYETINNLRSYQPGDADNAMFNHFREAAWCSCILNCCGSCCCPTYYVLRRNGMEVETSRCMSTRRDTVKWDRVRDVDFERDCCFGYVILDTWDSDLGNMKLRVRRTQAEKLATQIHNRSLGKDENAVDLSQLQFNQSACCSCLSCWRTIYVVSDTGLKVRSASCGRTRQNNIAWPRIHDVDGESTCCCSYIEITSSDRKERDEDRGEKMLLGASNQQNLQTTILRVWPSQFMHAFEVIKNASGGYNATEEGPSSFIYHPRGWCDCLTCWRGYCCFYHPLEYQITRSGLIVKRVALCSKRGMCRSRVNAIDWARVREVNTATTCCWGSIDIHTLDDEDPRITTRLLRSELDNVAGRVRGRGAKDTE